jgi:hypothetical protein
MYAATDAEDEESTPYTLWKNPAKVGELSKPPFYYFTR